MRIDRLELTNFRCFERATFTFAPGFNVLVGDNGAGKTAVLEALASGLDHALGGLPAHRLAAPKGVFRVARMVAHERDGAVSLEPQFPMALAWRGAVAGQPCRWSDEETDPAIEAPGSSVAPSRADVRLTTPDTARVRELVAGLARAVRGGASTTLPVIACYAADRLWTVPTGNRPDTVAPESRLQGYEHWASPDARGGRLAAWFKTQEFIAWQEGREPALLTMAREAIRGCIEGCTDVRYIGRYDALMVRFEAEAWMHFAMLSDGVRSMCALVGDLAYRCAELNPHLGGEATRETPGIVLIDELDLHLHPRWQRRVADDLRRTFPRVQFFATTHSCCVPRNCARMLQRTWRGAPPRRWRVVVTRTGDRNLSPPIPSIHLRRRVVESQRLHHRRVRRSPRREHPPPRRRERRRQPHRVGREMRAR